MEVWLGNTHHQIESGNHSLDRRIRKLDKDYLCKLLFKSSVHRIDSTDCHCNSQPFTILLRPGLNFTSSRQRVINPTTRLLSTLTVKARNQSNCTKSPNTVMNTRRVAPVSVSLPPIDRPQMIRCLCEFIHDDGFTIMCQKCARWCHASCFDIKDRAEVPEGWRCWICLPERPGLDKGRAVRLKQSELASMEEQTRNKQLDDLSQIPIFQSSVNHLKDCFIKLNALKVHGDKCKILVNRTLEVLLSFKENHAYDDRRRMIPLPEEISSLVVQIHEHIIAWVELSQVKSFIQARQISEIIQGFFKDLNRFSGAIRPGFAPKASLSQKIKFAEALIPLTRRSIDSDDELERKSADTLRSVDISVDIIRVGGDSPSATVHCLEPPNFPAFPASHQVCQNLFELLMNISIKSTDPQLRQGLNATIASMSALDLIVALARYNRCRQRLLELFSKNLTASSSMVRQAIQADDRYIFDQLQRIIAVSEPDRKAVLKLTDDDAEAFLDLIQMTLDKSSGYDQKFFSNSRRLLMKLSEISGILPPSLMITGIKLLEKEALFGGGFADIYKASYAGKEVALKRMRIFQRGQERRKIHRTFCKEALVWQQLRHPHVLPFLGVDSETFSPYLCMVSPWMQHGTIMRYLAENEDVDVSELIKQIAEGLQYLHTQGVVHGDLRGGNILINDEWQACLADFGLTVASEATMATHTSNSHGSTRWMAPELHDPESFGLDRFLRTPASDIYAFACVCLEIYTGRAPFADTANDSSVLLQVIRGGRPKQPTDAKRHMPGVMWELIERSWQQEPSQRLTISTVVDFLSRSDTSLW